MSEVQQQEKKNFDYLFIIPVFNEARIIEKSTKLLLSFLTQHWDKKDSNWKVIIADNGSRDETKKIVQNIINDNPKRLGYFYLPQPGRGNILKELVKTIDSKFYLYTDSDLPIEIEEIPQILAPLENSGADIVVGKRIGARPWKRKIMTWALKTFNNLFFDLNISDSQCGVKAFNKIASKILSQNCQENGWFLDTEFLVAGKKVELKVSEVPIHWIEQRYPERESKVSAIKDMRRGLAAVIKIFSKIYPNFIRRFSPILISGFLIITLAIINKIFISRKDFLLNIDLVDDLPIFKNFLILSAIIYLIFYISTRLTKNIPWKLLLTFCLIIFIVSSALAIFTHPTASQDIYWNLLLSKGMSVHHLNPYQTTPTQLISDSWNQYFQVRWTRLPMTHGPLWVLFLYPFTFIKNLSFLLIAIKFVFFLLLSFSLSILWKIMSLKQFTLEKKTKLLALFALNPLIMQHALIDAHNDIFVLLAILLGYYWHLKNNHKLSIFSLIVGGFFKYVSWMVIPVSLFYLVKNKASIKKSIISLLTVAIFLIGCFLIFYYPFGGVSIKNFTGLYLQFSMVGWETLCLTGTLLLKVIFGLNPTQLNIIGITLAIATMIICVLKNKPLLAFSLPYLVYFLMGNAWFEPWYLLWTLPLLYLYKQEYLPILISLIFTLVPFVITPFDLSMITIAIFPPLITLYIFYPRIKTFLEKNSLCQKILSKN